MKVYIVMEDPYESEVYGVYATREKAEEKALERNKRKNGDSWEIWKDWFRVEEWEVEE